MSSHRGQVSVVGGVRQQSTPWNKEKASQLLNKCWNTTNTQKHAVRGRAKNQGFGHTRMGNLDGHTFHRDLPRHPHPPHEEYTMPCRCFSRQEITTQARVVCMSTSMFRCVRVKLGETVCQEGKRVLEVIARLIARTRQKGVRP